VRRSFFRAIKRARDKWRKLERAGKREGGEGDFSSGIDYGLKTSKRKKIDADPNADPNALEFSMKSNPGERVRDGGGEKKGKGAGDGSGGKKSERERERGDERNVGGGKDEWIEECEENETFFSTTLSTVGRVLLFALSSKQQCGLQDVGVHVEEPRPRAGTGLSKKYHTRENLRPGHASKREEVQERDKPLPMFKGVVRHRITVFDKCAGGLGLAFALSSEGSTGLLELLHRAYEMLSLDSLSIGSPDVDCESVGLGGEAADVHLQCLLGDELLTLAAKILIQKIVEFIYTL